MCVMLTFWVLCQLASKCFILTGRTKQVLPRTYLMQINQSYAIWCGTFNKFSSKFWFKKSDVYHMHVHFLVHAVDWSVLFIRSCGLSSASVRQTFLSGFFVIIQYTTFGRCNWCVSRAYSLSSPYMLYSDVSILAPRSRHVPDISVPPLTIYIW